MTSDILLDSGLRVLIDTTPSDVVYAGIAVATGTRHELDSESGMAHLVEHMSFKGTEHLTSVQVLNRMERVGGDLNAYTGKEETIYYTTFLRQHLNRAIPLLLDIVFHSTYPQQELEKEVEVVIDEIESYNDSPSELIYDDFEALLFPDHPLGRKILGDADRLRQYTSADLKSFVHRTYTPARAILFVRGNVTEKEVRKTLPPPSLSGREQLPLITENYSGSDSAPSLKSPSPTGEGLGVRPAGGESVYQKPVHQSHVMLGARGYAATDPRYYGLFLLNNMLGGPAMNSRLSLALRERTGLVYTVESSLTAYTDTGVWAVYFGCDPGDVRRCLRLVHRELRRLIEAPLAPRTLAAAKQQLIGQMGISYDNNENVALSMAKRFLHTGQVLTPAEIAHSIEQITADELQTIAADILHPDRLTTLVYRPE